jgi:putative ABC transport system substrate-binding protein
MLFSRHTRRRTFITGLGSAAAWPMAARAQQRAVPVIGFLSPQSADDPQIDTVPFLQGLKETGFVEGQNVAVEYRYAENQYDRLPALAVEVVTVSTSSEIDTAFASLVQKRIDALWVSTDSLFANRSVQLVTLATHHRLPTIYPGRLYTESGGLMSYGTNFLDSLRQVGVYTGNILKGAKPADLPVARSTRFELVINLKTAKALGLTIPETLLATADEVIQ